MLGEWREVVAALLGGLDMLILEHTSQARYGKNPRGIGHTPPPPSRGVFCSISSNNVPRRGGRNGLLLGQKAGDQEIRTQHVQDARVPARIFRQPLHCLGGEHRVGIGPGPQQAMADVGQALCVGERGKEQACHQALLERPQERAMAVLPKARKTGQDHLEERRSRCCSAAVGKPPEVRERLTRHGVNFINDEHHWPTTFMLGTQGLREGGGQLPGVLYDLIAS
jgi:hypothetical protein